MKFLILLLLTGCVSKSLRPSEAPTSIRIELKGEPGSSSETRYHSHAHIKNYADREIVRDKQEIVDFTTITKIKAFDPKEKILNYSVRTTAKDGTVDLHDLAFPEKLEEIEFVVRSNGVVLKAGNYPPASLFFVPSMPVPDEPVQIGDTWTMERVWISAADHVPMKLDVVGILKNIVPCEGHFCADIEVSGAVHLVEPPNRQNALFENRVWGRLLFSPDRGDIIWSDMHSQEEMQVGAEKFTVLSCMSSETKLSAGYKAKLDCTP